MHWIVLFSWLTAAPTGSLQVAAVDDAPPLYRMEDHGKLSVHRQGCIKFSRLLDNEADRDVARATVWESQELHGWYRSRGSYLYVNDCLLWELWEYEQ